MKQKIIKYLLQKTGIYKFVWAEFETEFPIRISAKTPELNKFLEVQSKAFTDMLVFGMGCTQYVDPRNIQVDKDTVIH